MEEIKKIIREVVNENYKIDLIFESYKKELISEGQLVDKLKSLISKIRSSSEARNVFNKILNNIKLLPKRRKVEIIVLFFTLTTSFTSFYDFQDKIPQDLKPEIESELNINSTANERIRDISPELIGFIGNEEGSVKEKGQPILKPYKLGDDKVTVGYGHAEPIEKGDNLDDIRYVEALAYLKEDVEDARDGLNRILDAWEKKGIKTDINQSKYNAMVSMIFNMGIGNFRMSKFIQLVKKNKMGEASNEILNTALTYGDSSEDRNGLKNRRAKEKKMFDGNLGV